MTLPSTVEKSQFAPRRPLRRAVASVLGAWLLFSMASSSPALAQENRTAFLAEKLKADDYRVRTNAALALGATNDEAAVTPLCGAIADDNETVRIAVVAAMKRLAKPSAIPCLRTRLPAETSESVKAQIQQTIEALDINPNAKYYVAFSQVNNKTDRPQPEIEAVVLAAMKKKLGAEGVYQVAPSKETPEQAKATMTARKLSKGFYLSIVVEPFDYSSGTKAIVKIAIFTYPGKDLRAEAPGKAKTSAAKGDKAGEDNALTAASEFALEQFTKNVDQF
ncbi:MAG: HEAT repeat domain-containing protein [Polyangiaceae bacterium]